MQYLKLICTNDTKGSVNYCPFYLLIKLGQAVACIHLYQFSYCALGWRLHSLVNTITL